MVAPLQCQLVALGVLAGLLPSYILAGPVNVRIESDNNQNFHVGPEPRTRFELVEQYSPLATARLSDGDGQAKPVHRAFASSLTKMRQPIPARQPVQVIVDFGEAGRDIPMQAEKTTQEQPVVVEHDLLGHTPVAITHSIWLDWTKWTRCQNGERIRVRKCLKINNIPCETGPSVEKQKCYSTNSSGIKFAHDPQVIEKEILAG